MNWHYVEQGQQVGPVTEGFLTQLFQAGKITADTLVWNEELPDWQTYNRAMANRPPIQAVPPTLSPPAPALNANEVVCTECGKIFPAQETIKIGNALAACARPRKPIFLQKLSEGARINTGELDYARIPARFAAVFLDGLLLGAVNLVTNAAMGFMFASAARPVDGKLPAGFLAFQFVLFAINLSIGVTYEGLLIGKYGATLGKMACKIKVVTADGGRVTYARAFGRYFAKLLSAFTCLIGYVIALFDDQKRALHDRICDTRVVNK